MENFEDFEYLMDSVMDEGHTYDEAASIIDAW
jgi:hypothetical protein